MHFPEILTKNNIKKSQFLCYFYDINKKYEIDNNKKLSKNLYLLYCRHQPNKKRKKTQIFYVINTNKKMVSEHYLWHSPVIV